MLDTNDVFYFLCLFDDEGTEKVSVIDLSHAVAYKRDDYRTVNETNYSSLSEAINVAHTYSKFNSVPYSPFESKYNSETSEMVDDFDSSVLFEGQAYSFFYQGMKRLGYYYMQDSKLPSGDVASAHCFSEGSDVIYDIRNCEGIMPLDQRTLIR